MKVFLIENAPSPLFEVALTLYYTSSVPVKPVWVYVKVLISVDAICVHEVSKSVDFLKNTWYPVIYAPPLSEGGFHSI